MDNVVYPFSEHSSNCSTDYFHLLGRQDDHIHKPNSKSVWDCGTARGTDVSLLVCGSYELVCFFLCCISLLPCLGNPRNHGRQPSGNGGIFQLH